VRGSFGPEPFGAEKLGFGGEEASTAAHFEGALPLAVHCIVPARNRDHVAPLVRWFNGGRVVCGGGGDVGVPSAEQLWHAGDAQGGAQAHLGAGGGGGEEHRGVPAGVEDRVELAWPEWHEQDGDQPSGQAVRHERRRHHLAGARGPAPRGQDLGAGRQGAAGGDWRRGQSLVSFAGELLGGAEQLIRTGLHPSEIVAGYAKASVTCLQILASELVMPGSDTMDVREQEQVVHRMKSPVASKQYGQESILCPLIADACIQVCPKNPANFNVDNVRVVKILGGGIHDCQVVRGMVLKSESVGTIKVGRNAKVAVFGGGVDTSATETKGTVLINSGTELEQYAKTEEAKVEELIKSIAASGASVIVSGGAVGEMALHFCERYKLMVIKIASKFELRRFCRTTGAVSLVELQQPTPDELGCADSVVVQELGGTRVTIVKNETGGNLVATLVLRGSTDSLLDDVELAVDNGVNSYKAMCRDCKLVPGAGASEIELAKRLKEYGAREAGLVQYAIDKYADSLEVVPRILAENAGLNSTEIISSLYAAHAANRTSAGVDIETGAIVDMDHDTGVWDLLTPKYWALKLATDAACTVLRVDQITMAKQAGGPKPRAGDGGDED
jgi:T-complex protein 1 subunit theta